MTYRYAADVKRLVEADISAAPVAGLHGTGTISIRHLAQTGFLPAAMDRHYEDEPDEDDYHRDTRVPGSPVLEEPWGDEPGREARFDDEQDDDSSSEDEETFDWDRAHSPHLIRSLHYFPDVDDAQAREEAKGYARTVELRRRLIEITGVTNDELRESVFDSPEGEKVQTEMELEDIRGCLVYLGPSVQAIPTGDSEWDEGLPIQSAPRDIALRLGDEGLHIDHIVGIKPLGTGDMEYLRSELGW